MDEFPDIGAPDWGFAESTSEDITTVKFGDGYVLRMPNGINYQKGQWSPRWSDLDTATGDSVYKWLRQRKNLIPFFWAHPFEGMKKVVCTNTSLSHDTYGNCVLSASFEEDVNP